jgi:hypothetical protein
VRCMIALSDDHMAIITSAARRISDDSDRDAFFKSVADRLRPIPEVSDADVHKAVREALRR